MKKTLIFLSVFCLTAVFITSCEKEQLQLKLSIQGYSDTQTRTNESGFQDGDQVGIYVVDNVNNAPGVLNTTGNHASNVKFTYSATGSIWAPAVGSEIYWNDSKTKIDIYSYHPYNSSVGSVTAYPFSVESDQSSTGNYFKSDFLWAKAANVTSQTSPVNLYYGHRLSKVLLTTSVGDGFTTEEYNSTSKSMQLLGTKLSSTINLSTGVATATGAAGTITPLNSGNTYSAIVVPQTLAPGTTFIKMTVNGVDYTYALGIIFEPNKQYNISVKVSKNKIDAVINGITAWDVDPTTYNSEKIIYPMDGLVAWYPFNGNAKDESGNKLDGTVNGATLTNDRFGKVNSAYSFNRDQSITIANSETKNLYPLTISLWYNLEMFTDGSMTYLFSKYTETSWNGFQINIRKTEDFVSANPQYLLSLTNKIIGYYNEPAFNQKIASFNRWYHFVFIVDANGGKIYVDGTLTLSHPWTGTPGTTTNTNLWQIGGGEIGTSRVKIDDVRIYNRVLTAEEITILYRK